METVAEQPAPAALARMWKWVALVAVSRISAAAQRGAPQWFAVEAAVARSPVVAVQVKEPRSSVAAAVAS